MKNLSIRGLALTTAMLLSAGLMLVLISNAGAEQPETPAFLKTASYRTSARCKACHKTEHAGWMATKHTTADGQFPWEGGEQVELPAAEVLYRHTTGFNATANSWAEKNISCEACHGPGSEHIMAKKEERAAKILNPEKLTPRQQISLCGRCHGQYSIGDKRYAESYQLGQDLLEIEGFKLDEVKDDCSMQQLNEFMQSDHYEKGVTCSTCHSAHAEKAQPHNLRKPVNEQCMDCHKDITLAQHAPDAAKDATCATCHMPGGRHTFVAPK